MSGKFDSFDESRLGAFIQSTLDARAGGFKQIHIGSFHDQNVCHSITDIDGEIYAAFRHVDTGGTSQKRVVFCRLSGDLSSVVWAFEFLPTTSLAYDFIVDIRLTATKMFALIVAEDGLGVIVKVNKDGTTPQTVRVFGTSLGFHLASDTSYITAAWARAGSPETEKPFLYPRTDSTTLTYYWYTFAANTDNLRFNAMDYDGSHVYATIERRSGAGSPELSICKLASNGDVQWAQTITGSAGLQSSYVRLDGAGRLYLAFIRSGNTHVYALNASDGSIIWARKITAFLIATRNAGSAAIARNMTADSDRLMLIGGSGSDRIVSLSQETGEFEWGVDMVPTSPAVVALASISLTSGFDALVSGSVFGLTDPPSFGETDGFIMQIAPPLGSTYTPEVTEDAGAAVTPVSLTKTSVATTTVAVGAQSGSTPSYSIDGVNFSL